MNKLNITLSLTVDTTRFTYIVSTVTIGLDTAFLAKNKKKTSNVKKKSFLPFLLREYSIGHSEKMDGWKSIRNDMLKCFE